MDGSESDFLSLVRQRRTHLDRHSIPVLLRRRGKYCEWFGFSNGVDDWVVALPERGTEGQPEDATTARDQEGRKLNVRGRW